MASDDETIEALAHRRDLIMAAKSLSVLESWRTVVAIGTQWLVIAAALTGVVLAGHWTVSLCAIVVIGTRQHALGVLMHEGVHYRLFRNRLLNDAVGDLFCALPVGLLGERYRYDHLRHHTNVNTDDDPYWTTMVANPSDWSWPKSKRAATLVFLRDALGLGAVTFIRDWLPWFPWTNHMSKSNFPPPLSTGGRVRVYVFFAALLAALWHWSLWWPFLLYWMVPLLTVAQLAFKIRTMTEHLALPPSRGQDGTRHIVPTVLERLLVCPLNINHHLAHHLFPHLPWYNLPKMSALLLADSDIRARAHISNGYFGPAGVLRGEMIHGGSNLTRSASQRTASI